MKAGEEFAIAYFIMGTFWCIGIMLVIFIGGCITQI